MTPIARLDHRAVLTISGPDWVSFLNGLLTADTEDIHTEGGLYYAAFLRPQGKVVGDLITQAVSPEEAWLDVPASVADEILARLKMYRLRAKVELSRLDVPVYAAFGGALPAGFIADRRAAIIGMPEFGFSYQEQPANAAPEDWQGFRFAHGLSDPGFDFAKDELYAIEANIDLLDGIDFKKGCFIGQELTSRMKRRGPVKNRILRLTHTGPLERGAYVMGGERRVGEILSSLDRQSLALIKLDRLEALQLQAGGLSVNGVAVTLDIAPWIAPHLDLPHLNLNALPKAVS